MADALVISGGGPYADAWHDFAATSARLAELVEGLGHRAVVVEDVEAALSRPAADLLVLNIGNPVPPRPPDRLRAVVDGVTGHLAAGGGVLAVHLSIGALPGAPGWSRALGGRWEWGRSWHPDLGTATVDLRPAGHPVVAGATRLVVDDERYCDLVVEDGVTVLGSHREQDREQPMIWTRTTSAGRVLYDGLGHDVRSFDSAGHVELLRRAVRWLLHEL